VITPFWNLNVIRNYNENIDKLIKIKFPRSGAFISYIGTKIGPNVASKYVLPMVLSPPYVMRTDEVLIEPSLYLGVRSCRLRYPDFSGHTHTVIIHTRIYKSIALNLD